jgi:hypothetical protein
MGAPLSFNFTRNGIKLIVNDIDDVSVEELERAVQSQHIDLVSRSVKNVLLQIQANNAAAAAALPMVVELQKIIDNNQTAGDTTAINTNLQSSFADQLRAQGIALTGSFSSTTKEAVNGYIKHINANIQNWETIKNGDLERQQRLRDLLTLAFSQLHQIDRNLSDSKTKLSG